jgi:NAD(P)-dependent dehydrogenase (short-subunit alcohol dehydrogenase family)
MGETRGISAGRRWVVLGLGAAIAYGLGYAGFEPEPGFGTDEALYHALQLFALESPEVGDPSAALTAARFLAPMVLAGAAIQAIYALFRSEFRHLWVRLWARDHVVVAGAGGIGFGLATAFHDAGERVVVVERDPANPAIAGLDARGIAVIAGDASDPRLLARTRLARARYLFVTCGSDGVNLDVLAAAARAVPAAAPGGEVTVLVNVEDLALWRLLQAEAFRASAEPPFRTEFFNVLDAGARILLASHPPFAGGGREPPHLLFVGLETVGAFAVLRAAEQWRDRPGAASRLRVSVVGPGAGAGVAALLRRHPELESLCELATEDVELASARFQRGELACLSGPPPVTAAYVCFEEEAAALSAALPLRAGTALGDAPIVVNLWHEDIGVAALIGRGGAALAGLSQFPVLSRTLRPELLLLSTREIVARIRHQHYLDREGARGATRDSNPSMVPWDELPDSLKDSNRAFADGIGRKLGDAGCGLVPASLADGQVTEGLFDEAEVDAFARREHERWLRDLAARGWRRTDGPKDARRKLHPLLLDWDVLGEEHRERDRDAIRSLPGMLVRAGFVVVRGGAGPTAAAPTRSAPPAPPRRG